MLISLSLGTAKVLIGWFPLDLIKTQTCVWNLGVHIHTYVLFYT